MVEATLRRGGSAAKERQLAEQQEREANKKNRIWGNYDYLRLAAPGEGQVRGESKVIRLITDEPEWIEVKQHNWVKTKPAPKDKPEGKGWPATLGAVCRYTENADGTTLADDCYICDHVRVPTRRDPTKTEKPYASTRMWALAVEREEIIGTQEMHDQGLIADYEIGSPVGYVDATYEKPIFENGEDTGKTETRLKYLILNFGMNFFDKLLGVHYVYKTVVDRDFRVTRVGAGKDTDYDIVGLEPITGQLPDGTDVKWDLRNPKVKELYEPDFDLLDVVLEQASDAHYNRYFNTEVEVPWSGKSSEGEGSAPTTSAPTQKQEDEAQRASTTNTLDAVRARMQAKVKASA